MTIKNIFRALALSTALLTSSAYAALPGYYVGGQVGWGDTHYKATDASINGTALSSASVDNTNIAGRVFGGYQFNPFWAVELGYTQFSNTSFKNINGVTGLNGDISQYAVDLAGKGILPLTNSLGLYGKFGAAYIKAKTSSPLTGNPSQVNPTYGLGASYDLTPNVPLDLSWYRIQEWNSSIPSTDLFSLGIAYHFG